MAITYIPNKKGDKMTHTPTPWEISTNLSTHIFSRRNGHIASVNAGYACDDQEAEETAKFIVKAVNNHEALVKALEIAYRMMSLYITDDPSDKYLKRLDFIQETLKNLEGEVI